MKNLFFLVLTSLISYHSFGQISEVSKAMSKGVNNAVILDIPDSESKVVEKVWKVFIKDLDVKAKKHRKSKEWQSFDPIVSGFSTVNLQSIFARVEESGGDTRVLTWFELDEGYLNSEEHLEAYNAAQILLMNFGLDVAREYTQMEFEEEEKKLKKMQSNLKRLVREKETHEKNIKDFKQKIIDAENNIENNIVEQENTQKSIKEQIEAMDIIKEKISELSN